MPFFRRNMKQSASQSRRLTGVESLEGRQLLIAAPLISELHVESDTETQFVEIQGTPDAEIPSGTYFVVLNGEGAGSTAAGNIQAMIDLGGLQFGSNGHLVITQGNSPFAVDSNATVISGTDGFDGIPDNRYTHDGSLGANRRFSFLSRGDSYLLIESATPPVAGTDYDSNDDGVLDSSMYGFSGEIRSVDHAIVVLGFRTVRDLAVSAAAADMFAAGDTAAAARETLWHHSLGCASAARSLGALADVAPAEAFLAGIVHDVGKLIFFDVIPDQYAELSAQADAGSIVSLEDAAFGINHQQIGQACAEEWGLPAEINSAIGHHHTPASASASRQLVAVVCVADALARAWNLGGENGSEDELAAALERAELPVSTDQIEELREQVQSDFRALQESCES